MAPDINDEWKAIGFFNQDLGLFRNHREPLGRTDCEHWRYSVTSNLIRQEVASLLRKPIRDLLAFLRMGRNFLEGYRPCFSPVRERVGKGTKIITIQFLDSRLAVCPNVYFFISGYFMSYEEGKYFRFEGAGCVKVHYNLDRDHTTICVQNNGSSS